MEKELEVKILNIDTDLMEEKVIELGGRLISHEKQKNILIDSSTRPIKSFLDGYLRIRESENLLNAKKEITFTLKKQEKKDGLRTSDEFNTRVDNSEVLLRTLNELGFDKIENGYKERKSYEFQEARLDFDVWDENTYPYPYMEIEVKNKSHLDKLLEILEIDKENVSTKSIKELKDDLRK